MVITIESNLELTFEELCIACNVTPEFMQELMEFGILEEQDHFDSTHLSRIRTVIRLQHDLDVNLPGAAVIIDMLEEIEELRAKIAILEKNMHHF